jgi:hypothetical protein
VVGTNQRLSRRELLACALGGSAAILLGACGAQGAGQGRVPTFPTDFEDPGSSPPPTATAAPPTPTLAPTPTPRPPVPMLVNPQFRRQDTPATNSLSPDGYTWAQGTPIVVDRRGTILAVAQKVGRVNEVQIYSHVFVFSNDAGATWHESSREFTGLSRGSLAYDDQNDILHALWRGQSEADAVVYRRYTIERDASDVVRDIHADPTGDRRLDGRTGAATIVCEHPIISWLPAEEMGNRFGAVLCVWTVHNSTPGQVGNEVRASLCLLSNTQEDTGASAWFAPGPPSTATIGNAPAVPYTALVANSAPAPIYPSLGRKRAGRHAGDLYLFYADGGAGMGGAQRWCWRRFSWRATDMRWESATPEAAITPLARSGPDGGYEYKGQLGTKVVEDPKNGRMFFGFTTWKDAAAGDTWNFAYVAEDDTLSPIVDVYSCGGRFRPELYALTGDLVFDTVHSRLAVAYVQNGEGVNHGLLRVYDGVTPAEPETRFFTAADVDIPLLWQDARTGQCRYGSGAIKQLLVLFRDTNGQAPPYRGWFGTLDWATR